MRGNVEIIEWKACKCEGIEAQCLLRLEGEGSVYFGADDNLGCG